MPIDRRDWPLIGMLAPYVVGAVVLIGLPGLIAFLLSFTNYDGLTTLSFVGFDNFAILLRYNAFQFAVRNTIGFITLAVPLRVAAMLGLSLLLQRPRPGTRFIRVLVFLPTIIPDTAYALLWSWIFNPVFGPINGLLNGLGLPSVPWIVDRSTLAAILLVMSLFQIGEGLVVLLAALYDIPNEYYEAAAVDGSSNWQQFRYITFPLLRPWLILLTLRDIILGAQAVFTPAMIMVGQDRTYSSWFMPQMIYEEAFSRLRFGLASGVIVVLFLLTGGLFYGAYRVLQGWGYDA